MNIISYLVTSPLHCLFLESDKWVLHQNMLTCLMEKMYIWSACGKFRHVCLRDFFKNLIQNRKLIVLDYVDEIRSLILDFQVLS